MSHILVVDDSPMDRMVAGQSIELGTDYHIQYASDGIQALEHMEARLPLAVVTDLQMPDMDGMQLVKTVHKQFPKIPVILMTAHGSEDIAVEALLSGAADYVPKIRLKSDLPASVESVLALTVQNRPQRRLSRCLRHEQIEYELDNDAMLIPPLAEQLQHVAMDFDLIEPADAMRFSRSIVEALRNAIFHGNLELPFDQIRRADRPAEAAAQFMSERQQQAPYRARRVYIDAEFTPVEARIRIRDEGPGFDVSRLPNIKSEPSHLSEDEGRGLVLIQMFMDETLVAPPGNEITLVKRAPLK